MAFVANCQLQVQHPQFCRMEEKLRPQKTPSTKWDFQEVPAYDLSRRRLKKCADDLRNKCVCLYVDGKSSIHNDSIMYFSDNVSWLHYIYQTNVIDTSCQPYTAENLQEIAMSSIRNSQEDFSAVTDIGPWLLSVFARVV